MLTCSERYKRVWGAFQITCGTGQRAVIYEKGAANSALSDAVSSDLKRRGMKFVGTTIIYAYMRAVGIIYSHEEGLFSGTQRLIRKGVMNRPFTTSSL